MVIDIIKNKIIELLLYSANKKAKNMRDQYRLTHDKVFKEKKEYYYSIKDKLLDKLAPSEIHIEYFYYNNSSKVKLAKVYALYKTSHRSFHKPLADVKGKDIKIKATELAQEHAKLYNVDTVKNVSLRTKGSDEIKVKMISNSVLNLAIR